MVGCESQALDSNRDDWIRTSDLFHPKEARYRAAPRPVLLRAICFNDQRLMLASALSNVNKSSRSRLMTRKARRTCGGNSLPLAAAGGTMAAGSGTSTCRGAAVSSMVDGAGAGST